MLKHGLSVPKTKGISQEPVSTTATASFIDSIPVLLKIIELLKSIGLFKGKDADDADTAIKDGVNNLPNNPDYIPDGHGGFIPAPDKKNNNLLIYGGLGLATVFFIISASSKKTA